MRNHIIFVFLILISFTATGYTQETYLNPGLKFGHTFGDKGGYTIGFEISYTWFIHEKGYGAFIGIDYCAKAKRIRYNVGAEYLFLAIGPTLIVEENSRDVGLNVTPFAGLIFIPYYSYTYRIAKDDLHELGSFLKIPIQVSGEPLRFGH